MRPPTTWARVMPWPRNSQARKPARNGMPSCSSGGMLAGTHRSGQVEMKWPTAPGRTATAAAARCRRRVTSPRRLADGQHVAGHDDAGRRRARPTGTARRRSRRGPASTTRSTRRRSRRCRRRGACPSGSPSGPDRPGQRDDHGADEGDPRPQPEAQPGPLVEDPHGQHGHDDRRQHLHQHHVDHRRAPRCAVMSISWWAPNIAPQRAAHAQPCRRRPAARHARRRRRTRRPARPRRSRAARTTAPDRRRRRRR